MLNRRFRRGIGFRIQRDILENIRDFLWILRWLSALTFVSLRLPMHLALAVPFDCSHNYCGIDGEYPNLVVGTVDGGTSPSQAEVLFDQARSAGLWKFMPAGSVAFAKNIQAIPINVTPGQSLTVRESREEMDSSPVTMGQLVRFSPHRGAYDTPHPGDPYWFTFGCVAVLCSGDDHVCAQGFRPGIYRVTDGAARDNSGRQVVEGAPVIDVMSMRVKTSGH
jgi:hypothetical protein